MAYTLTYALIHNDIEYAVTGYTGEPISVIIPSVYNGKSVTAIDDDAFADCHSLTSVVIPDSVTLIGYGAFEGCDNLKSVVIGDSVTTILESAFYNCTSLTSVAIPESVTSIADEAFEGCSSLTSVVIPDSVTSIGRWVFQDCSSLKSIVLLSKTPPTIYSNTFPNISASAQFYCYFSVLQNYQEATNWKTYADKFVADDLGICFTMNSIAQKKYIAKQNYATKTDVDQKIANIIVDSDIELAQKLNQTYFAKNLKLNKTHTLTSRRWIWIDAGETIFEEEFSKEDVQNITAYVYIDDINTHINFTIDAISVAKGFTVKEKTAIIQDGTEYLTTSTSALSVSNGQIVKLDADRQVGIFNKKFSTFNFTNANYDVVLTVTFYVSGDSFSITRIQLEGYKELSLESVAFDVDFSSSTSSTTRTFNLLHPKTERGDLIEIEYSSVDEANSLYMKLI